MKMQNERPISFKQVWPSCPKEISDWLTRHVRLQTADGLPFGSACTELRTEGYVITISNAFMQKSEEFRARVVQHEMGHILRGDLVYMMKMRHAQNFKPMLWNYCADNLINTPDLITPEIDKEFNNGFVTWPKTKEKYDEALKDFKLMPGTRAIYDALEQWGKDNPLPQQGCSVGDKQVAEGLDPVEAEIRHLEATLDAPKGYDLNLPTVRRRTYDRVLTGAPLPKVAAIIKRWVRRWKVAGNQTMRMRSWMREGRIHPELQGSVRQPTAKVLILLDVSGSMSGLYEEIFGAAAWLMRLGGISAEVWLWADRAAKCKGLGDKPEVGGGTDIGALWRAVGAADVAIVFTDGFFEPGCFPPERLRHVLYVVSEQDGGACALRPQDGLEKLHADESIQK